MPETWNLSTKYTKICRKYTFYYQGPLNFADVSILHEIIIFFDKNSAFIQNNSVRAVLENFYFYFQFL